MITNLNDYKMKLLNESVTEEDHIVLLNMQTLEEINTEEWEIDKIVSLVTDPEEINKYENAGVNVATDLSIKKVKVGQTVWATALLKPRNKSRAYQLGEMGVLQLRVVNYWYGLNKLDQLKRRGKI